MGACLDRQGDPGVAADVADLAVLGQVGRHQLVAVQSDPHDRDLRSAIGFQRHQVRERRTFEDGPSGLRDRGHAALVAFSSREDLDRRARWIKLA